MSAIGFIVGIWDLLNLVCSITTLGVTPGEEWTFRIGAVARGLIALSDSAHAIDAESAYSFAEGEMLGGEVGS